MSNAPLDNDLVAQIAENLKGDPSDKLRDMLAQANTDQWSPEAFEAARTILEQRSQGLAVEPFMETTRANPPGEPLLVNFVLGESVLAPRRGGQAELFPGMIGKIRAGYAYIYFDDGDRCWVALTELRPFTLDVGDRVTTQGRGPGTIIGRDGERLYVRYDAGDGEWITRGQIVAASGANLSLLEWFGYTFGRMSRFVQRLIVGGS